MPIEATPIDVDNDHYADRDMLDMQRGDYNIAVESNLENITTDADETRIESTLTQQDAEIDLWKVEAGLAADYDLFADNLFPALRVRATRHAEVLLKWGRFGGTLQDRDLLLRERDLAETEVKEVLAQIALTENETTVTGSGGRITVVTECDENRSYISNRLGPWG